MKLPSVEELFGCCQFSARKGASAIDMLAAISNGNIRLMLDATKRILVSNHLDTAKIRRKIKETGAYIIPDFEAVKTLLHGDYNHYDPRSSIFINLFDIYQSDPKEHFTKILMLEYLSRYDERAENEGFVARSDFDAYIESFYFTKKTITAHLDKLTQTELIGHENSLANDNARLKLRISPRGRFHLFEILNEFQYFDSMIIDTPIIDATLRARVAVPADSIEQRVVRTENFIKYLRQSAASIADAGGLDIVNRFIEMGATATEQVKLRSPAATMKR